MTVHTDVAIRQTIGQLCEARDAVIRHLEDARRSLELAKQHMPDRYGGGFRIDHYGRQNPRAEVDRTFWRRALDLTGFRQVMDAAALADWQREVDGANCPEFTEDNVVATFLTASQQAGEMFDRGVWRVFVRLDGAYRSNTADAFKVLANHRYVLTYMLQSNFRGGQHIAYRAQDQLNDIDRVVRTVRGEVFNPRSLESAMNEAFAKGSDYESDLYKARAFGNGNMHLWFRDAEAVERINEAIARHAGGSAIPRGRAA